MEQTGKLDNSQPQDNSQPEDNSKPQDNSKPVVVESLETIMKDLEAKVNPKTMAEGIARLQTNSASILGPMEAGAKEFEQRTGRSMTYGEMRAMWG